MIIRLVSEILLKEHNARQVFDNTSFAALRVIEDENWERVLEEGDPLIVRAQLDTGWSWWILYAWRGYLYVFIPGREDNPGVVMKNADGSRDWHGVYFGRVVPG